VDFSLRQAVADSLRELSQRAAAKGLTLECKIDAEAPELLVAIRGGCGRSC